MEGRYFSFDEFRRDGHTKEDKYISFYEFWERGRKNLDGKRTPYSDSTTAEHDWYTDVVAASDENRAVLIREDSEFAFRLFLRYSDEKGMRMLLNEDLSEPRRRAIEVELGEADPNEGVGLPVIDYTAGYVEPSICVGYGTPYCRREDPSFHNVIRAVER